MCEEGKERMGEKEFKAKGFLLYTDDEDFFKDLDDDEAGILIKALFRYFNRGETPKEMTFWRMIGIARTIKFL